MQNSPVIATRSAFRQAGRICLGLFEPPPRPPALERGVEAAIPIGAVERQGDRLDEPRAQDVVTMTSTLSGQPALS